LPEWFDNEKEIQNDMAKVKRVDRYDICGSDKVSENKN
jgi:hypothetical protein